MKKITERTRKGDERYIFELGWLSLIEAVIQIATLGRYRGIVVVAHIQAHLIKKFDKIKKQKATRESER